MEMDEDIEDFVEEDYYMEPPSEFDWEYEFDAAHYFDFAHQETYEEAQEADRWFSIAGNYPASPLSVKLRRVEGIQGEHKIASSSLDGDRNIKSIDNTNADVDMGSQDSPSKGTEEAVRETKTKPWNSTLMKPTASHLAKLKKGGDLLSNHLYGRIQRSPIHIDERRLQNCLDNLATKRQKLEIGYLRKVYQMKQQALLHHEKSKKDRNATLNAAHSKLKVTIPKEPALETLQRAKNRRSRANSETSERSESSETQIFKERSVNRKMLKPPSIIPPIKSKQQLTEFQVFNLKTTARALQRPADWKRSNSDDAALKKEKNERSAIVKARHFSNKIFPAKEDSTDGVTNIKEATVTMESKLEKDEKLLQSPPTELFKKLSLRSEMGDDTISRTKSRSSAKDLKENAPDSFQPEFWRGVGKVNQCGSVKAITGIGYQSNVSSRSLGIR